MGSWWKSSSQIVFPSEKGNCAGNVLCNRRVVGGAKKRKGWEVGNLVIDCENDDGKTAP